MGMWAGGPDSATTEDFFFYGSGGYTALRGMWAGDLAVTQTQEASQGWDRHREVPACQ